MSVFILCTITLLLHYVDLLSALSYLHKNINPLSQNASEASSPRSPSILIMNQAANRTTNKEKKVSFSDEITNFEHKQSLLRVPRQQSKSTQRNQWQIVHDFPGLLFDEDRQCIICLQSLHDQIEQQVDCILNLLHISRSQDNQTEMISQFSQFRSRKGEALRLMGTPLYKCENTECAAFFHDICWKRAMRNQLKSRKFDTQTQYDHITIELRCPHCNFTNQHFSNVLKDFIQEKETLTVLNARYQFSQSFSPQQNSDGNDSLAIVVNMSLADVLSNFETERPDESRCHPITCLCVLLLVLCLVAFAAIGVVQFACGVDIF